MYSQGAVKAMGDQALGLRLENAAVSGVTYVAEFFLAGEARGVLSVSGNALRFGGWVGADCGTWW